MNGQEKIGSVVCRGASPVANPYIHVGGARQNNFNVRCFPGNGGPDAFGHVERHGFFEDATR
jgi:hypothetical protein